MAAQWSRLPLGGAPAAFTPAGTLSAQMGAFMIATGDHAQSTRIEAAFDIGAPLVKAGELFVSELPPVRKHSR